MEVVLDRDAFLKGLQMVHNIVEPRQTLPILANVLLETETEAVRVTATDLEVGARVSVPAKVGKGGAITVAARKLSEIVRELPAAALTLKVGDNAAVNLRCGGSSYRLVGLAPDDFPPVVPAGQGLSGITGIVPRKAVVEIARVLGSSEDVQIAITENQFVLQMPNFVMTARLIEGQFPNYDAVVPKAHPGKLVLPRGPLMAALRRVSVMAEERNKPVKLLLRSGSLTLSAASHDLGEAEESVPVAYTGEELPMGFNSRYLLEALTPIEKDEIVFEFKDGLSPGVVKGVEEEGYCCVIMPMRI